MLGNVGELGILVARVQEGWVVLCWSNVVGAVHGLAASPLNAVEDQRVANTTDGSCYSKARRLMHAEEGIMGSQGNERG